MNKLFFFSLPLLISGSVWADGNEPKPRLIESYTSAKPLEKQAPKFPKLAARRGSDGWVKVSYVIGKDGKVKDVVAIDSIGESALVRAAVSAVKEWTFEPAKAGDEYIEQCDNAVQVDFLLTNGGVTKKFHRALRRGQTALDEKDIEGIQQALKDMDSLGSKNMSELFWRSHLSISLFEFTGDAEQKYHAVNQALSSLNAIKLNKEEKHNLQEYLLLQKFLYEANNSLLSSALYNFNKLKKMESEAAKAYQGAADKIQQFIDGEQPIFVSAEISDKGRWSHYLSRRAFSVTNIEGRLDKVEVRCSRKFNSFTIQENSQWQIPESWGKCNIHMLGAENSKFDLVELTI